MSITIGIVARAWSLVVAGSLISPVIVGCATIRHLGGFCLDEADGTDFDQLMADATTRASLGDIFDQARDACQVLEDYSFLHDGPCPLPVGRTAMNATGLRDGNEALSPCCDADPSVGT